MNIRRIMLFGRAIMISIFFSIAIYGWLRFLRYESPLFFGFIFFASMSAAFIASPEVNIFRGLKHVKLFDWVGTGLMAIIIAFQIPSLRFCVNFCIFICYFFAMSSMAIIVRNARMTR